MAYILVFVYVLTTIVLSWKQCRPWQGLHYQREQIGVYPRIEQPENPNSSRARRRENCFQRERKKARKEAVYPPQLVLASSEDASDANAAC